MCSESLFTLSGIWGVRDLETGFGLMTGFIAHVYNLLLLFTNHCITNCLFSSSSSSTAVSRDYLNSLSCLRSSLYSPGAVPPPPQENIVSNNIPIVVCLPNRCLQTGSSIVPRICFRGNVFAEPLLSNELFRLSGVMSQYCSYDINLHNVELNNLHSSTSKIRIIKSRRMWFVGYVARTEEKGNSYKILMGKRKDH
jgi:hypothetical protein